MSYHIISVNVSIDGVPVSPVTLGASRAYEEEDVLTTVRRHFKIRNPDSEILTSIQSSEDVDLEAYHVAVPRFLDLGI